MLITPKFEDFEFKPGTYTCIIEGMELKTSKAGNQYVDWSLCMLPNKFYLHYCTPIEGRGAGMFKHFIHSAGEESYRTGPVDTDTLLGRSVECVVELETYTYQGVEKSRMKVKEVRKSDRTSGSFSDATDIPF